MKRLYKLNILLLIIAISIFLLKEEEASTWAEKEGLLLNTEWLSQKSDSLTPEADRRPADQTFLTFPEWFLVHGPREQAEYFQNNTSTTFPLMTHVDQIWDSYNIVNDQLEGNFAYNSDYQLMIQVIATSSTVEYGIKAGYENIFGRVSLITASSSSTDEDRFAAQYAQDYVDFLGEKPWYEFDFKKRLINLWGNCDFLGENMIRKLERRYMLSTELIVKAIYGKLIGMGTESAFEEALLTTVVVTDNFKDELKSESIQVVKILDDGRAVLRLPRYAPFTAAAQKLANAGISFQEIAGNDSAILISLIVNSSEEIDIDNCQVLFQQTIPTRPDVKRVALVTTVPELAVSLRVLAKKGIKIEHIYDY